MGLLERRGSAMDAIRWAKDAAVKLEGEFVDLLLRWSEGVLLIATSSHE